ncbi:MAG: hypothetical protein E5Y89_08995 [Mesorhizobium sp.]|uniref:hypothetical protein n=1 Tax=unclassified Mesorhizobium TaxID=325217 RepID=UPI000FCA1F8E|nr:MULTISPECIES: hypothetical protein [unclassified Mesorhizobium]RVC78905.1 hypothetical protein EN745_17505 [Mesorhizobium sp. M4A.F.Ca.ET.022.05.2.1]RVD70630.1 hypothetical protein EN751_19730 [Mesorhizobium sp. M4A.F.Ca.ET.029.04.2.1]TIL80639.1 MAG: hypothetical protein E5Y89_08995 [Mesorhizobium sp.]TIW35228.1 MAG: hypothetical protein E5V62_12285 [Mesorhizobium sp.]
MRNCKALVLPAGARWISAEQGRADVQKSSRPKETALWAIRRHVVYFRFRVWRRLGTAIDGKNGDVLFANNLAMVAGLSYSERK